MKTIQILLVREEGKLEKRAVQIQKPQNQWRTNRTAANHHPGIVPGPGAYRKVMGRMESECTLPGMEEQI
jgi:hypothetical protein